MSLCWCSQSQHEIPPTMKPVGAEREVLLSGESQGTGPRTEPAGTLAEAGAQKSKSATSPTVIGVNAGYRRPAIWQPGPIQESC